MICPSVPSQCHGATTDNVGGLLQHFGFHGQVLRPMTCANGFDLRLWPSLRPHQVLSLAAQKLLIPGLANWVHCLHAWKLFNDIFATRSLNIAHSNQQGDLEFYS